MSTRMAVMFVFVASYAGMMASPPKFLAEPLPQPQPQPLAAVSPSPWKVQVVQTAGHSILLPGESASFFCKITGPTPHPAIREFPVMAAKFPGTGKGCMHNPTDFIPSSSIFTGKASVKITAGARYSCEVVVYCVLAGYVATSPNYRLPVLVIPPQPSPSPAPSPSPSPCSCPSPVATAAAAPPY